MNPLSSLVKQGTLTANQRDHLEEAIEAQKHVLVTGASGSGKTAVLQAIINTVDPQTQMIAVIAAQGGKQTLIADAGTNLLLLRAGSLTQPQEDAVRTLYRASLRMRGELVLIDGYPAGFELPFADTLVMDSSIKT